jgi:hypothetical protein
MQRLLFVSDACIKISDADAVASHIVTHAQIKNARLGVTGALIFTYRHFAQVLEGSPESLQILMASIYNDQRHDNIVIIDTLPITRRQFPDWQMAYQGPSSFVSRHVTRLLHADSQRERQRAAKWVTELAWEFSRIPTLCG